MRAPAWPFRELAPMVAMVAMACHAAACGAAGAGAAGPAPTRTHFIQVHLEAYHAGPTNPGFATNIVGIPADLLNQPLGCQQFLWPVVKELVADADAYGFALTLTLNPQWADFILSADDRTDLVRTWRLEGHEIAFHHHPFDHPDWNGYTNDADLAGQPLYRGTVSEAFSRVARLMAPDVPTTAGIGGLPAEAPLEAWRGITSTIALTGGDQYDSFPDGPEPLASLRPTKTAKPAELDDPGGSFISLNARQLGVNTLRSIEEAMAAFRPQYLDLDARDVFGLVFHDFDYHEARDRIRPWFELVASSGGTVRTVHEIVASYPYPLVEQHP